jgi:hypothetical protein
MSAGCWSVVPVTEWFSYFQGLALNACWKGSSLPVDVGGRKFPVTRRRASSGAKAILLKRVQRQVRRRRVHFFEAHLDRALSLVVWGRGSLAVASLGAFEDEKLMDDAIGQKIVSDEVRGNIFASASASASASSASASASGSWFMAAARGTLRTEITWC